ncbi:hypothetical protein ACVWWG_008965 [Bradyrhizobium sp. LB7.2]
MVNVSNVISSFKDNPGYVAMRGLARFPIVRNLVTSARGALNYRAYQEFLKDCEKRMDRSFFKGVDRHAFVKELDRKGLAFGLMLPEETIKEIRNYADKTPVYADRKPNMGFIYDQREAAEAKIGKPILVAQYFNARQDCGAIAKLVNDPFLEWVAAMYLGSVPTFVGSNLWWTSPVQASDEDKDKHAHFYHRDVDDFRFFKYFFYVTDVKEGEGAHICVLGSITNPPVIKKGDKWNIRRYTDAEINGYYPAGEILEITGPAGTGFAEDTLCIHKGSTPKTEPRLLLQIQYALFDYGTMNDDQNPGGLALID